MKGQFTLALAAAAVCLVCAGAANKTPILIYNPSPSAPIGWYKLTRADDYQIGNLVAAKIPDWAAHFAHSRGYLPEDMPVIKTLIAGPETRFCIRGGVMTVPDFAPFVIHSTDSQGRDMPVQPDGCRSLDAGEYLLGSVSYDRSFDSRYFGSVGHADLIGRVSFIGEVE